MPARFVANVRGAFGERGGAWLAALPELLAEAAGRWGLTVGAPFELSFNYVAPATRADGSEVVLKLGVPNEDLDAEIAALRLYGGDGICRLLDADAGFGALLLERIRPGTLLVKLAAGDDDAATRIGAGVARRLRRPVPDGAAGFRSLATWFVAFGRHRAAYGGPGPFPSGVLDRAEHLAAELLATAPRTVLLHGDFHHHNVLHADPRDDGRAGRSGEPEGWLAIDPKGIVGDPGYDMGPFLLNPEPWIGSKSAGLLRRRLDILADELAYPWERLRDWGIAHAVLSACWNAEDGADNWHGDIAAAEALIGLTR